MPQHHTLEPPPLGRNRGFRIYLAAQTVHVSSVGMQRIVQSWLVLQLTASPVAVGLAVALQYLPLLVVGPAFGLVADRHDKRRIVLGTTAATAGLGLGLALLVLSGQVATWHVYVVAVLLGLVSALDQPARQVLVSELVGDGRLRAAVSTNNVAGQVATMVSPAVGGLLMVSIGEGRTFLVSVALAVTALGLLAAIRPRDLHAPHVLARARGQVREGVRFLLTHPTLPWVVLLAGCIGVFGLNGPVVLAAFADDVWGTGSAGFGLYTSLCAVGAMVGAVVGARVRTLDARLVVVAAALFGALQIVAAVMPTTTTFGILLVLVGVATLLFITSAATYVQLSTPPTMRGRVLAIYSPVLLGGHAVGGLLAGALTQATGVRTGLVVVGVAAIVSAVAVGLALLPRGGLRAPVR
ncbi:MFS transporter [Oerskovia flava]|uniref:MFS transporter n=1 Tax=Oerskovia flava TaxID=2986422 RepID=UPI00223F63A5|nr:MFS transporter [Oerskovia sp. JB1-3-2]